MAKRSGSHPLGAERGSKKQDPKPGSRLAVPFSPERTAPCGPPAEALALFQRGMEALQRHAYRDASAAFNAVVMGFPNERALLDRARVYLELCQRESSRRPPAPRTIEERLTAATAALNNGEDQAAEELVRSVLGDDPKHDLALYLLAAVFARRGSSAEALDLLGKAIALSPEASAQARTDDDFTSLHDEDAFWTLTEPPIFPAGTRRSRARG
jgi:tetratricopeptide (TPR) repeat protein